MARLNIGDFGFNMADNRITYGDITGVSANTIQFRGNDGTTAVVTGSFAVVNGQLSAGTMNTYTAYFANGLLNAQVTGASLSIFTYDAYVNRGDMKGLYNLIFAGNDIFTGGAGNDIFIETRGNDIVAGGAGTDAVIFDAGRSSYTINRSGATDFQVTRNGATTTYSQMERLIFGDGTAVAYDASGTAGQTYRVYQAAFGRTPDQAGLSFWINSMDMGASLTSVAQGFVNSSEFKNLYGANASNTDIVAKLYQNVLGRAGERVGTDYWVNELNTGRQSVAQVLSGFAESAENQARVIGSIQNGIAYTPYG